MKILVYGAGVLGSLHAARLHEAGHEVSLVARGTRLVSLRKDGVRLAEGNSTSIRSVPVPVVEHPAGPFDLILVFVRSHQVAAVLESIAGVEGDVVFLLNWAAGAEPLAAVIGRERIVLGFASQGGTMDGDVVRYRRPTALTSMVPMSFGELDGRTTERVRRIAQTFRSAGFRAKIEPRMDAWLKTHAAFEVPLSQAMHTAGGLQALAGDPGAIRDMIHLMKQNLEELPTRPVPRAFNALRAVPEAILVRVFRRFLGSTAASPLSTTSAAVFGELDLLAQQLRALPRR